METTTLDYKTIDYDILRTMGYLIASSDLPLLKGTVSQVETARLLRIDRFMEIHFLIVKWRVAGAVEKVEDALRITSGLRGIASATWWIAQRGKSTTTLLWEGTHRAHAMESGETDR